MSRLTPLVMGVLAVLLAGCASAAIDQPTATASVSATSTPSSEPTAPLSHRHRRRRRRQRPRLAPVAADRCHRQERGPRGTGNHVQGLHHVDPGGADGRVPHLRVRDGRGPGDGTCLFDKAKASPLAETLSGATSADVSLDSAVTGAGVRCLYVVALNAAGESSPTLAWSDHP